MTSNFNSSHESVKYYFKSFHNLLSVVDDSTDSCTHCEPSPEKKVKEIQFMYIQMEFCDNQTLRNAIDNDLYQDHKRVWRMFREIIEGLLHIHSQGMIHRDLKPVNIFLDSSDQVKIGDFGLATTNIKAGDTLDRSVSEEHPDMTGQIGTAMYVAPEINAGKVIAAYSQKVDIYRYLLYSYLPNKRVGLNNRVGWKIGQNLLIM